MTSFADERLRCAPTFGLALTLDGRAYLAKDVEPYTQFWLSDRERVLHSLFAGRRGETVPAAIAAYLRLTGETETPARRKALVRTIDEMRTLGVLMGLKDDASRYDAAMAEDYLRHRPFPEAIAQQIIAEGGVAPRRRVLDLAGGPGSLALRLARETEGVALMELSRGFIDRARRQARRMGLPLETIHESCNRLVSHDFEYDVVTVSQALHWLDDVAVCRGLCRVLAAGGSFFVVVSAMSVADQHPLSFVLGDNSLLGAKSPMPFPSQIAALNRRLAGLFDALDARDVQRVDLTQRWEGELAPIAPAGVSFFAETRPFGPGYARAFLTPRHIAQTGLEPEAFWAEVGRRWAASDPEARLGRHDWALLHFKRGASGFDASSIAGLPATPIDSRRLPQD